MASRLHTVLESGPGSLVKEPVTPTKSLPVHWVSLGCYEPFQNERGLPALRLFYILVLKDGGRIREGSSWTDVRHPSPADGSRLSSRPGPLPFVPDRCTHDQKRTCSHSINKQTRNVEPQNHYTSVHGKYEGGRLFFRDRSFSPTILELDRRCPTE